MSRPPNRRAPQREDGWRDRRPAGMRGGFDAPPNPEVEPPKMMRSRVQLATSYAPGVLLTWEGGKGICRSVPIRRPVTLERTTQTQIFDGIREFAENWQSRALSARPGGEVPPALALDPDFFDPRSNRVEIDQQHFEPTDPSVVGYVPYPLVFQCGVCGRLREFTSVDELDHQPLPRRCGDHDARWTQVDVVYAHWSGSIEPLSPSGYRFDPADSQVHRIDVCTCGARNYSLRNRAPVFSEWRFVCNECGVARELKRPDHDTFEILEADRQAGGRQYEFIEVNMLPVSYRANSAFYPQRGNFIEFRNPDVVDLLTEGRRFDLARALARIYDVPFAEPSEAEIETALRNAGRAAEWEEYQDLRDMLRRAEERGSPDSVLRWRDAIAQTREAWYASGVVQRGQVQSPALVRATLDRENWARRYDPIRLALQHNAFVLEHIAERLPVFEAVDVMTPDAQLSDVAGDPAALARYRTRIGALLGIMGVEQMVLIRGLPICEFSFGYSRVSPGPVYHRESQGRSVAMPVRLKAFDALPISGPRKHPIYVTQQRNEALYFRLDEAKVRRWLELNQVPDTPAEDGHIGQRLIETYQDFGPFLEDYKDRERGGTLRSLGSYVYLLLHSLAHQLMHSLADLSGLDADGLGEHLFPADLAFVLYRKGMTPDLGNISAMWRNHSEDYLQRAIDPRLLRCGSGSLCDSRSGACPACIMVSEVTCVASNQLLSRAALRGGPAPTWEATNAPRIVGFFDERVRT